MNKTCERLQQFRGRQNLKANDPRKQRGECVIETGYSLSDWRPVILACSGPSLLDTPVWEPGYPVCAVSTAIRSLYRDGVKPDYWVVCDRLNPNHGAEGTNAMRDPEVHKVTLKRLSKFYDGRDAIQFVANNIQYVRRGFADQQDESISFGTLCRDGSYLAGYCLSMTMALQWLVIEKMYNPVIICGCDLSMDKACYAHEGQLPTRIRRGYPKIFDTTEIFLRRWYETALEHGVRFMEWNTDGRLSSFMESWDGNEPV